MELHKVKERIIMKKALALILTAVLGIQAGAVSAEELSSGEGLDIVVVEESDDTEAVIEETIILEDDLPDESVQEELIAGDDSLLTGEGDDTSVQQSDDISGILKLLLGEIPARTGETGQDPDFSRYEELFSLLPKPEAGQPEMDGITPEIVDELCQFGFFSRLRLIRAVDVKDMRTVTKRFLCVGPKTADFGQRQILLSRICPAIFPGSSGSVQPRSLFRFPCLFSFPYHTL